jgi:GxxExxY protein
MIRKEDIKKISDYIWEIPKDYRKDMKVPARIFATEKMLDDILEDKTLWQLINVASLPGIYEYALAMPDAHEGYGFCLTKDAKILTEHGYFVEIKDLEKFLPEIQILSFDKNKKILDKTKVIKFFKLKPYGKILRITTNAGFIIEVTEDHPIFTPEGMKEAKSLMIGDKVAVYGFEGVPYEKPSSEIIFDEEKIKKTFYKIKTPKEKSSLEIIIKKLKERNILPLTYDNPKFPYLIKICAFIFGDGSMNFIGKRKDGILNFSGKKEDLLEIKKDLEKIGYTSSKIFKRTHICKDGRMSFRYDFYVNASSLVVLLATLGAPLGRKVNQKYNVPKWLFKTPLWQKRLFLAVLFGCKLKSFPKIEKNIRVNPFEYQRKSVGGFNAPVFTMNKRIDLIENGKKFLRDIAKLCQEFGVRATKIQCRRLIVSKDGNKTKALELVFSSSLESLLNLWSKIGYEYNQERKALASLYTIYLKHKKRNLEKRKEILSLIPSFFDQNLSYAKIAERLKSSGFTKRLILDFCYRIKNGYSYKKPKIPQNFITLKEFIKQNALGKSGLCFDEIEKIEEVEYNDLVYDLTTLSKAHNFIANNFLVSNCVGGVAAFDYEEGIISPGGIGFDINCVHPETRVNLDFGTYLRIKDLVKRKNIPQVISFDPKDGKHTPTNIVLVLKKNVKKILEIKTKFGYRLLLTEDHPVFNSSFEKILAKDLKVGDEILIYPFKGVKYGKPKRVLIVGEDAYLKFLRSLNIFDLEKTTQRYVESLKKLGLLPLYLDNPLMPYIIKLLGYSLGRGSGFVKKKTKPGRGHGIFLHLLGEIEDLKEIGNDLKKLNVDFSLKKIYNTTFLNIKNRPFIFLLFYLGAPFGKKNKFNFKIPQWLFKAPKFYQRLFLASLFGSQGQLIVGKNKTYPEPFTLSFNINRDKIDQMMEFAENLKKMLENNFGIKTLKTRISFPSGVKGKTAAVFLYISSELKNMIRFLETINFEYNKKKKEKALALAPYLRYKLKIIALRNKVLKTARRYWLKYGYSPKLLREMFIDEEMYIDEGLITKACTRNKNLIADTPRRFIRFENFKNKYLLEKMLLIRDEVEEIKIHKYSGEVFDITVENEAHNFFANNILVSNCGVRLAVTDLDYEEVKDKIPKLTEEIFKQVPSGVGRGGFWKLSNEEMKRVLEDGAKYMYELGYAEKEDLEATESFGKLEGDPDMVSKTAKERGRDQLGTMGAGNHFVEIQRISDIFGLNTDGSDKSYSEVFGLNTDDSDNIAKKLGLEKGKIAIMIHCGSRGLGHQVCSDYVREFLKELERKGIDLVDKELAYGDFHSELGQRYFKAMNAAANFAFANRQLILHQIRKAFKKVFGKEVKIRQVYDVAHNMAKIEEYADWFGLNTDISDKNPSDIFGLNTDISEGKINLIYEDLTYKIIGAALEVKKFLGLGQKEIIYQNALEQEFRRKNLNYEREKEIKIKYKGEIVGYYKPDFIIENKILVEIKSVDRIDKEVMKQIWYYLRNTDFILALILNFSKNGLEIKRVLNLKNGHQTDFENFSEKQLSEQSVLGPKKSVKLIVHRKGATRAFWKGHPDLVEKYREIGQPTLIPGSMGTASYVLIGQELAGEISFGSAPHGAGRLMSRAEAKRKIRGSEIKKELEKRGISIAAGSMSGLAEEAPAAYKDVSEVVEVVHQIGIARKLAKLVPVGVIKG